MQIVFFRYLPLTQKIVDDFYMKEIVSFGYDVDYWDITPLFFSNQDSVENYIPSEEEKINVKYVKTRKEFNSLLKKYHSALFISLMSFGPKLIWMFHSLKRFGCRTAVFSYYPLPLHVASGPLKEKLLDMRKVVNGLYTRISIFFAIKLGYIKLYDYVFKGGTQGWKGIGSIKLDYLKKATFFEVNNWDYDKFLRSSLTINNENFIVFLDEYYPFHPDALMLGQGSVDPEQYFKDINKVFTAVESFYGMPVVIAAHPKALKYKEHNYFGGREVRFNSTLDLVARASYVLAHDSLSIGFAIMCKKPLIFIDSMEIMIKLPQNSKSITAFANYFYSPLIYPDKLQDTNFPKNKELNAESGKVYENMITGYMTTLKGNRTNVELLEGYLKTIFKQ